MLAGSFKFIGLNNFSTKAPADTRILGIGAELKRHSHSVLIRQPLFDSVLFGWFLRIYQPRRLGLIYCSNRFALSGKRREFYTIIRKSQRIILIGTDAVLDVSFHYHQDFHSARPSLLSLHRFDVTTDKPFGP